MHAYTVLEDTPTDRKLRFEQLMPFDWPDGTASLVRTVHWEARPEGFPDRLWVTNSHGWWHPIDPLADLPDWLAATAPHWADR